MISRPHAEVERALGAYGFLLPVSACAAEPVAVATGVGLLLAGGLIGAVLGMWIVRRGNRGTDSKPPLRPHLSSEPAHSSREDLAAVVDRSEFEVRLARLLDSSRGQACQHILLCIAIDGIEPIRDSGGAEIADELSHTLAAMLGTKIRRNDTLCRLHDDEFTALLPLCPLDQGLRIANAIREATRDFRFDWQERSPTLAASIGLVLLDGADADVASALSAGERTRDEAKRKGADRVHVFRAGPEDVGSGGDARMLARLSNAFERGDFVLFQQPIRPLNAAVSSSHFEILVRMRDERGALLLPADFLPVAERYNLLTAIDRLVVVELLKVLEARMRTSSTHMAPEAGMYSLNLSGASINDSSFLDFLRSQLARYPVPPSLLCFEITETVAISNLAKAADLMHELKTLGCRFALDDFGIGMSSFAYLKYLPVDFLKIDGTFVRDMHLDEMDYAIVDAINRIARTLGMQTVAEIVEHRVTLELLTALGVDYAQGHHIAVPEPLVRESDLGTARVGA